MKRSFLFFLTVLVLCGCNQNARSQQEMERPPQRVEADIAEVDGAIERSRRTAITQAVSVASPAIVSINVISVQRVRVRDPFADDPFFRQFFGQRSPRYRERAVQGLGSGFVISPDGYIVTNDHVAGNAAEITVAFPNGETLAGTLVGTDPASDLALIKVDPEKALPYLAFAEEEAPIVGEWVIALGNPFGLFQAADPTVTVGVVSAVGRDLSVGRNGHVYRDMIQTDAAINQGNSGGPLVNAVGEVIGVNTAIYSESGGSIGIGFAVPAARALRILEELREHGVVDRSYYTGLYGVNVDQRIARALRLDAPRGILVRDVEPQSPADIAGFAPYDVIIAVEGEDVDNTNDFFARLNDFRPGDEINLDIIREGRVQVIALRIGRQGQVGG